MHHVEKVIATAADRNAEVLILRIYTPGELADSMREIITEILGSETPVVGYVAPPGAHAASAGNRSPQHTLRTSPLASDIARSCAAVC
jgi:membrane-bound ClpP family serine protease